MNSDLYWLGDAEDDSGEEWRPGGKSKKAKKRPPKRQGAKRGETQLVVQARRLQISLDAALSDTVKVSSTGAKQASEPKAPPSTLACFYDS